MTTADGRIIGTTRIVDNGSPAERFNLVIVAEGYQDTVADMTQFANDAQQYVMRLFATPPFDGLQNAFNVFRIDVASTDSGADDPAACGGTGATRATYFDASFCNGGIQRLLQVNNGTVMDVVNAQVPQWHQILVIVNSTIWGGSGGSVGVTSKAPGWENIAIHEFGHAAFGLADEYEYWAGCGIDTNRNNHSVLFEPSEPNVTINNNRATVKWSDLILAGTPVPTTTNANCAQCDPQASPVAAGTVGVFEGAHYFHCGAFRSEFDCMMRNLQPFCAVCRRRIRETLSPYLRDCERVYRVGECIEERDMGYWRCDQEEDQGYNRCDQEEDQGYNRCDQQQDQGYNRCDQQQDQGYNRCCDWWPCSWFCDAWVWVSHIVCVAWTWVSHIVCVAWTWVSHIVCVLWTWISHIVCVLWTWLSNIVCVAWRWTLQRICLLVKRR